MPSASVDSGAHNYAGQDHEEAAPVNMAQPDLPIPDLPPRNAKKEDHVAYVAATTSLSPAEADELTKDELFELEGRAESSAGTSSSTSASKPGESGETSTTGRQSPAPDAESPFSQEPETTQERATTRRSSSASSTGGSGRATTSARRSR